MLKTIYLYRKLSEYTTLLFEVFQKYFRIRMKTTFLVFNGLMRY